MRIRPILLTSASLVQFAGAVWDLCSNFSQTTILLTGKKEALLLTLAGGLVPAIVIVMLWFCPPINQIDQRTRMLRSLSIALSIAAVVLLGLSLYHITL